MAALRDELYMQMRSIHNRYDCVRKVMIRNPDLQKLAEKQANGTIQKLWCDWTFSDMKNSKEAHKTISRENARRMIDTSNMLRQDHREAYQSGRLSVYMKDVVRQLERLQKNESEENEKSKLLKVKVKVKCISELIISANESRKSDNELCAYRKF